jgi:hypothetical protein
MKVAESLHWSTYYVLPVQNADKQSVLSNDLSSYATSVYAQDIKESSVSVYCRHHSVFIHS